MRRRIFVPEREKVRGVTGADCMRWRRALCAVDQTKEDKRVVHVACMGEIISTEFHSDNPKHHLRNLRVDWRKILK